MNWVGGQPYGGGESSVTLFAFCRYEFGGWGFSRLKAVRKVKTLVVKKPLEKVLTTTEATLRAQSRVEQKPPRKVNQAGIHVIEVSYYEANTTGSWLLNNGFCSASARLFYGFISALQRLFWGSPKSWPPIFTDLSRRLYGEGSRRRFHD